MDAVDNENFTDCVSREEGGKNASRMDWREIRDVEEYSAKHYVVYGGVHWGTGHDHDAFGDENIKVAVAVDVVEGTDFTEGKADGEEEGGPRH